MKKLFIIFLYTFLLSMGLFAQPVLVEVITTPVSCNGGSDGTIFIKITGGQAPYTFTYFRGSTYTSSPFTTDTFYTFNNVRANDWHITVEDDNAEGFTSFSAAKVTQPGPLNITSETIIPITCTGAADGEIQITAAGESGSYNFEINPGGISNTSGIFKPLGPGDYTVTVTDATGCSSSDISNTLSLTNPPLISILSESATDATCFGVNNGTVTVTAGGGTPPYSYTINPGGTSNGTGLFTNLAPNNYIVEVTDVNNCLSAASGILAVSEPDELVILTQTATDITCNGAGDGIINVTASGGTGPYLYTLSPGNIQNATGNFPNLSQGNYVVSVNDASSCGPVSTGTLVINEPASIIITAQTSQDVSCSGAGDGEIQVTATGGTAPLTYTLNPGGASNETGTFTLLDGGSYTVTVNDANGCPPATTPSIEIIDPDPVSILTESKNDISCNGANDGRIEVTAGGGTGILTFTITPGNVSNTTGIFNNLGPATYIVTVEDENSCPVAASSSLEIIEPTAIVINTENATDITCTGAADGIVSVTVSGGTPPYNFTLLPGGQTNSTGTFTGLTAGNYRIAVTDASLCPSVTTNAMPVAEPLPISANIQTSQDVSCSGAGDGSISVTASGGTEPLSYTLEPGSVTNGTGTFNNLSGGNYTVTVNDANGCPPASTPLILITDPDPIIITNESKNNISCNGAGNGSITITAEGGTGTLTYTLNPGAVSNTTGIFNNLAAGDYNVTVNDENSCPPAVSSTLRINEPGPINVIILGSSNLSLDCFGDTDGRINININGGNSPYATTWTGPNSFNSTQEDINGLVAGTYILNVTDANNCSLAAPLEIEITEPPALTMSLTANDVTCFGDADGSITVTAGGGTPGYQYSRNGITYQASNVFINLSQNNYTIFVRDNNGCIISDNITISEPDELIVASELREDNNQCYGDSLGVITILEVEGGERPYEYSIDGGGTFSPDSIFTNLPAGSYQTVVKDANDCIAFGNLNVINQPSQIKIINYAYADINGCFGDETGQIFIEASGGTISKTYTLDGNITNTTGIFSLVAGGEHEIIITDLNGCTKDTTVTLSEPDELIFTSVTITDITSCAGNAEGEVVFGGGGGTGALSYAIDTGPYGPSGSFSGLAAGEHRLWLRDNNGCEKDSLISISEPLPLSIVSETSSDASCNGANDGSISITAAGGTPGYTYTLNPGGTMTNDGNFINLAPGDYTVDVTDVNNCGPFTSSILTIGEPVAITVDSVTTREIVCNGDDNGEIHIFLSGGTPPYSYSIDDGVNYGASGDFVGLSPGSYRVAVKDANGCELPVDTLDFSEPPALTILNESVTDITTCYGDPAGEISFEATGGTGIIEYSIDAGNTWQAAGNFSGLTGGDYTILARDENACQLSSSLLTLSEPDPITADISSTPALEGESNGSITIANATGGTGILEYSINGIAGPFTSETVYTGLTAGIYSVIIRDENACTYEEEVNVSETLPLDVTTDIDPITCFNANDGAIEFTVSNADGQPQYSIDDSASWSVSNRFENLGPGTYNVFIKDGDRVYQDVISLTEPPQPELFRIITPASCNVFTPDGAIDITVNGIPGSTITYAWSDGSASEDLNNVEAGTYWVRVSDENLCSVSDTITIPSLTTVIADAGEDTTVCYGTQLRLNGQGGSSVLWSPADGLSDPAVRDPLVEIFDNASYVLRAEGNNNCYDLDTLNISVLPTYGLSAGNDTSVIETESITISTTGGPYLNYSWDPAAGVDDTASASPTITIQQTTTYIVSAEAETGCIERDTITISLISRLVIYNAFTPNNDGVNDFWDIENAEFYPDITVEVFNRWGERLFSSKGYTNDKRWDGTFKGRDVPIGTYYYVVIPKKGFPAQTGPITIVR